MNYKCNYCGNIFHEHDQTISEHKFGQCPACGSEEIEEIEEQTNAEERIHSKTLQTNSPSN